MIAGIAVAVALTAALPSGYKAVDGDTLRDNFGRRIRLLDIDAPELAQTCKDKAGALWHCGRSARDALANLLQTNEIKCVLKGKDKYKRDLGTCFANGELNINQDMVLHGWALPAFSIVYELDGHKAAESQLGMYSGTYIAPWEWRKGKRWN